MILDLKFSKAGINKISMPQISYLEKKIVNFKVLLNVFRPTVLIPCEFYGKEMPGIYLFTFAKL